MCKRGPIQPDLGYEVRTTKETKNPTTTWKQHGWLPFFFVSRINGDTIQVRSDSDFCRKFSFFFGKLTYVLKEEDTNIIKGIPQIYNDNRNIK
jgi:hypothetical protein